VGRPEPADPRDPAVRVAALFDAGTVTPLGQAEAAGDAYAARGRIDGVDAVAYATDPTRMGGAIGTRECARIAEAIDAAARDGVPVVGLWHSGGARLADGVESMDGIGTMFAAMIRASGRIPQISVVLGPAAGGAAYGPALTDLVVMAPGARVFITGPDVVRQVTGERIDMEGLGGPDAHGRRSGVAHLVAESEEGALDHARRLVALLGRPVAPAAGPAPSTDPRRLLPDRPQRAYDVRPLVHGLLDPEPAFVELQPEWAPNMVVGLGRLDGRTLGVIANNPVRKAGCLDSLSAEKAARFVRMCDAFGVPLLVIVDVPGYLPGVHQEWDGVVRRGAKLLHAFGASVVPRITLITRKSYGGAYIAMNSRALGATHVLAWPDAEVAVMGAEPAVGILHRKKLAAAPEEEREALRARLVEEHVRVAGGVGRARDIGVVDEVIAPADTRRRLGDLFASAAARRGLHGNIPL